MVVVVVVLMANRILCIGWEAEQKLVTMSETVIKSPKPLVYNFSPNQPTTNKKDKLWRLAIALAITKNLHHKINDNKSHEYSKTFTNNPPRKTSKYERNKGVFSPYHLIHIPVSRNEGGQVHVNACMTELKEWTSTLGPTYWKSKPFKINTIDISIYWNSTPIGLSPTSTRWMV